MDPENENKGFEDNFFKEITQIELIIPPELAKDLTPKDIFLYKLVYKEFNLMSSFIDEYRRRRDSFYNEVRNLSRDVYVMKNKVESHDKAIAEIQEFHKGCSGCRKYAENHQKLEWFFKTLMIIISALVSSALTALYLLNQFKELTKGV